MKFEITDRRKNPTGKSLVNRQRFIRRHARQMREAVRDRIREGQIEDLASDKPKRVKISTTGTDEPVFRHDQGGVVERVLPGNREFDKGDRLPRPQGGSGRGDSGASTGEAQDDFVFEVSQEEFLEYFFEGLELPDLIKRTLTGEKATEVHRAGFSTQGIPANIDPLRTMKRSHARRTAFRIRKIRKRRRLLEERDRLVNGLKGRPGVKISGEWNRVQEIDEAIRILERQIKAIPFLDDVDIQYRRHEKTPVPISQAVMFCLMDVSASMGEWEKEMAKRFFILLYLFLTRNYQRVEIVFIRHHHEAEEVDEEAFFRSRDSGGTVVSTALVEMARIIEERYPTSKWNIYGCHASDGDNAADDLSVAFDLMSDTILPLVQYFAYVEIDRDQDSALWPIYEAVRLESERLAMARITDVKYIYPVFRSLFESGREETRHDKAA